MHPRSKIHKISHYPERRPYKLYEPRIEQHYLYRDERDCTYPYGHMVSLAHFDGRFHAVWNNHHGFPYAKAHRERGEPFPYQRLVWQTSRDAKTWSDPVRITEERTETPLDTWSAPYTHWQPNLLNYHDRELWCLWSLGLGSYNDLDRDYAEIDASGITGTYLSILPAGPNATWRHRRIFAKVEAEAPETRKPHVEGYLFPSQNPAILSSGRVVVPVTLVPGSDRQLGSLKSDAYFSAVIYSDDDGATWQLSNLVTNVENIAAQWEPHVLEQADGRLRMYIRDMPSSMGVHVAKADPQYRMTIPNPLFLTTTGTGARKGEPVIFDPDAKRVWMETECARMHRLRLPCGRYVMFHHDVWNNMNRGARSNLALFFSRTDEDDYVAGPGIAGRSHPAHYPQGIVHDGKLYVAYTRWNAAVRSGGSMLDCAERGIAVSIIDPLPQEDRHYVWPRDKDQCATGAAGWREEALNAVYTRPFGRTHDGRECVVFKERGSAGIEIDVADFEKGETLGLAFRFKILKVQPHGNLVLCSFGSRIPIRIGIPGNRPGLLYAYSRRQWERVGTVSTEGWNALDVVFGADEFTVRLNESEAAVFTNTIRYPEQRLYLGEGYEVDFLESNTESEFVVELDSLETRIQ